MFWIFTLTMKCQKEKEEETKQYHLNLVHNVEEMDKFLEKYNFPKLNQEEVENLNRPITSTEIETVIRNLLANKSPGPGGFTAEFNQKFREPTSILEKAMATHSSTLAWRILWMEGLVGYSPWGQQSIGHD